MRRALSFLSMLIVPFALVAACSDDDPRYGPPGGIAGRTIDYGTGPGGEAGGEDGAGVDAAVPPSNRSAPELFADLYATITDLSEAKGSTCLPCHRDTQVPKFMLGDATMTRASFLGYKFDDLTNGRFYNKGEHTGHALTATQKTLAQQWAAAEHAVKDGGGD